MKRLYIIVEGQTEEAFVKEVLAPYLLGYGIFDVRPIKITTSKTGKGGFVNYQHVRNDALNYLKKEIDIVVTTFVDYFRMPTSMPNYQKCTTLPFPDDRIDCLEKAMEENIGYSNFVPYIQKFEFEALLFSDNSGFEAFFDEKIYTATQQVINEFENPEEINTHPEKAPSKRLERILKNNGEKYEKVDDGNLVAIELGIEKILNSCPRFKNWVDILIEKVKE
jgi:hypothetical protein